MKKELKFEQKHQDHVLVFHTFCAKMMVLTRITVRQIIAFFDAQLIHLICTTPMHIIQMLYETLWFYRQATEQQSNRATMNEM